MWLKYIPLLNVFVVFYHILKSFVNRTASLYAKRVTVSVLPIALVGMLLLMLLAYIGLPEYFTKVLLLLLEYIVVLAVCRAFEE